MLEAVVAIGLLLVLVSLSRWWRQLQQMTGKKKVHWRWRLLAYAFVLALSSCFIYMTVLVPNVLKPNLFIFDPTSSVDESYKNAHQLYERKQEVKVPREIKYSSDGDSSSWWDARVNTFLHRNTKATSFIIKQPKQALKQWKGDVSELQVALDEARAAGEKAWEEVLAMQRHAVVPRQHRKEDCPVERALNRDELEKAGRLMVLPCGLQMGSSVTVVAKPLGGHMEYMKGNAEAPVMVKQFLVELQALKPGRTEDPPRVLHVNPRISGDWSGKPVVEVNSCFHGKWGVSQRCDGSRSSEDETVDGLYRCEEWSLGDEGDMQKDDTESFSWLKTLFGNSDKSEVWRFPFSEDRFFVLTIRAGWEGYHINVDGRHVVSFPYREDFSLEDATGVYVGGYVEAYMAMATSLPLSNLSIPLTEALELSEYWKPPAPPEGTFELFIGVTSTSSHFAERMAARKSWMQSPSILLGKVVARFFVALCADNYINLQVKQEADFYGDVIIVPFIDRYELVVQKTIALCDYGIHNVSANYIMKCDDDTFTNVESILNELEKTPYKRGLYMGNINKYHRPQRTGKWAVTYKEWPEEEYPLYADGPGYVISVDIARFIVAHHEKHTLRKFKMEDVSMGLWVSQFALSYPVYYIHHSKFCQWGCVEDYYTAHYMSPRQMACMWEKLSLGRAKCCNASR